MHPVPVPVVDETATAEDARLLYILIASPVLGEYQAIVGTVSIVTGKLRFKLKIEVVAVDDCADIMPDVSTAPGAAPAL